MQINWKEQIDKIRHMVDTEPSLFAFCVRDWDITEQAGLRDLAWALARDDSYATRNDAKGLLELLEAHLTQRAGGLPTTSADIVESIKDDDEREDMNPLFYGSR